MVITGRWGEHVDKHIFSTYRLEVVFRCQTTGKLVGSERKLKLLIESHLYGW